MFSKIARRGEIADKNRLSKLSWTNVSTMQTINSPFSPKTLEKMKMDGGKKCCLTLGENCCSSYYWVPCLRILFVTTSHHMLHISSELTHTSTNSLRLWLRKKLFPFRGRRYPEITSHHCQHTRTFPSTARHRQTPTRKPKSMLNVQFRHSHRLNNDELRVCSTDTCHS